MEFDKSKVYTALNADELKVGSKEPWKEYGLARTTYIYRKKHNIPFNAPICPGRVGERYSGMNYKNTPEKIEELRRKYANGITSVILDELLR